MDLYRMVDIGSVALGRRISGGIDIAPEEAQASARACMIRDLQAAPVKQHEDDADNAQEEEPARLPCNSAHSAEALGSAREYANRFWRGVPAKQPESGGPGIATGVRVNLFECATLVV
jgi:hypothetical protein